MATNTSKVHPAGFIAVSRRFHPLAWVLRDPYRTDTGTTPSASSLWQADGQSRPPVGFADSNAVRLEAFGRIHRQADPGMERIGLSNTHQPGSGHPTVPTPGPKPQSWSICAVRPVQRLSRRGSSRPLVSVLVSFTPVRHRSPAFTLIVFVQFADCGGRR